MDSARRASAPESIGTTSANGNGRRGVIDLARLAVEDTIRLVQQEIQLAKVTLKEALRSNLKAAVFPALAAASALLFFLKLLVKLAVVMPTTALLAPLHTHSSRV